MKVWEPMIGEGVNMETKRETVIEIHPELLDPLTVAALVGRITELMVAGEYRGKGLAIDAGYRGIEFQLEIPAETVEEEE